MTNRPKNGPLNQNAAARRLKDVGFSAQEMRSIVNGEFRVIDPGYPEWLVDVATQNFDSLKRLSSEGIQPGLVLEILGMIAWAPVNLILLRGVRSHKGRRRLKTRVEKLLREVEGDKPCDDRRAYVLGIDHGARASLKDLRCRLNSRLPKGRRREEPLTLCSAWLDDLHRRHTGRPMPRDMMYGFLRSVFPDDLGPRSEAGSRARSYISRSKKVGTN